MDVNQELKFFGKFKKKKLGAGGRVGGSGLMERRIEVFVKIQKKIRRGGRWEGSGWGGGGQDGWEQRIEVFVKIQKKIGGGGRVPGGRGRVWGLGWM